MKEIPLSTCEKNFIIQAIKQNQRLDGRKNDEFRNIKIHYGADWGSVMVALGETKVLGQVSSELGEPKATRPNEGMFYINVELGPMAAPHFESGRNCELTVQINRTLERTFKDSKSLDLESLCITAEERVWILRVDLNVLNHEGNLIDCCSIATLCALMHYRRPEVSIIEDDVVIHKESEKDPLPMVMHHYPVCVSYCTFDEGRIAVADPTVIEERTSDSQMIFGINSFRELCCLNLGGSSLTSSALLLQCSKRAAHHAKYVVELVKATLEKDLAARESRCNVGFTECLKKNTITSLAEDRLILKLRNFTFEDKEVFRKFNEGFCEDEPVTMEETFQDSVENTAGDKWETSGVENCDIESLQNREEISFDTEVNAPTQQQISSSQKRNSSSNLPSDSEEEEQIIL
ncbi:exosome complex component RRP45 isoform X2 [Stomoxys calcitrans]|uniref:Exosome complex component RRP45 n=1 Tax=Stomoxys calcitrans TaxID=35570 RepID=A0A1I8NPR4_STOCA|nr:exosome complex component RRP45 isoform X2 [Stomoxys calcitrans]